MEWFKTWFASPYYHILYKNRDHQEAENFISNLLEHFQPKEEDRFLDLACGAGRHSIFLNKKGYEVVGVDLSAPSIETASEHENDRLSFFVHDMRNLYRTNYFNYIFNLFTSFGYFENEYDNIKTLKAIKKGLKNNGKVVIDFMNAHKVVNNLVANEEKTIDQVDFKIKKSFDQKFIYKNIQFKDEQGLDQNFTEMVQYIDLNKFESFCEQAGLKITHTFGDFNLNKFDLEKSDRLILVLEAC